MKILFLGPVPYGQDIIDANVALQRLGHECGVSRPWNSGQCDMASAQPANAGCGRGAIIRAINRGGFLNGGPRISPELVWAEKQESLHIETFMRCAELSPSDPLHGPESYFSLERKRTRLMDEAMPPSIPRLFQPTTPPIRKIGVRRSFTWPLVTGDEVHRPLPSSDSRWHSDVGFLGGLGAEARRTSAGGRRGGNRAENPGKQLGFLQDGRWSAARYIVCVNLREGSVPHS